MSVCCAHCLVGHYHDYRYRDLGLNPELAHPDPYLGFELTLDTGMLCLDLEPALDFEVCLDLGLNPELDISAEVSGEAGWRRSCTRSRSGCRPHQRAREQGDLLELTHSVRGL